MKVLIKLGGTLLDAPESRQRLASEIRDLMAQGIHAVVVHGGGKQMTRYLAERGIESTFVNGLRVTSAEVLDAVLKVFAGTVNHQLVAAFSAAGVRAVGLTGMDAFLTEAEQLSPALGFVGKPVRSDPAVLHLLSEHGYLPVVACVGGDRNGNFYNVNADQMAVACASAYGADKLLFLTDVAGVCNAQMQVFPKLTVYQCQELIDGGVATGGMRAKLESAVDALNRGVGQIAIAPGMQPGVLRQLMDGDAVGTLLVAEAVKPW